MWNMFLLFLGLSLTHYIDWPWWQVALPLFAATGIWLFAQVINAVTD